MKRLALGVILALVPCVALAQPVCPGGDLGMIGPCSPILVDTDTTPGPTPGTDTEIVPVMTGPSTMLIPNPWEDCQDVTPSTPKNVLQLSRASLVGGGPFTVGTRTTDNQQERIGVTQYDAGRPIHFAMNVEKPVGSGHASGDGGVVDANGDHIYDDIEGTGGGGEMGAINFLIDIVIDGSGNYATIPWAEADALAVQSSPCVNGGLPAPIHFPIADSTGDGVRDAIVLDLDGNGIPDPQFLLGPVIAGAQAARFSVPTLSQWGILLAGLAIAAVAWIQIRSSGLGL